MGKLVSDAEFARAPTPPATTITAMRLPVDMLDDLNLVLAMRLRQPLALHRDLYKVSTIDFSKLIRFAFLNWRPF
ncbi:hypothetical protein GCM10011499_23480 [Pelagibacterium lentulum]|uniref:Uncharacterized protein n=1 Tax=Pelagibacterium lentulum TaxID=2029865 RepID=A0A916RDH9_9HYPH|nr:hypothetical protein GCM10011499_23480 [Pelagibacterium lentulum]